MIIYAKENLNQLKRLLLDIEQQTYTEKAEVLSGGTIGQQIRHILEYYLLLIEGTKTRTIQYNHRRRDPNIEIDPTYATVTIDNILLHFAEINEKHLVNVTVDLDQGNNKHSFLISSFGRELAYCIEHSIHHQRLIKAALVSLGLKKLTDDLFGVNPTTRHFRGKKNS